MGISPLAAICAFSSRVATRLWGVGRAACLSMVAAPSVSFIAETNLPGTAGFSVTVSGIGFGTLGTTPSARVGLSACGTASWASASSVVCQLTAGDSLARDVAVTVAGVAGTRTAVFSYDGAALVACDGTADGVR